jgi:hypothetical protein
MRENPTNCEGEIREREQVGEDDENRQLRQKAEGKRQKGKGEKLATSQ